ncbi:hypothetical protein [Arthrobacter sp. MMS18-M83]|uniref:hypothetical protein n=1 Tax=Arthrobacter sp. MMS18-M83 TaxID=2996261 RepID=UPI00227D3238|nr:hypothetical protein [Arthrobacter sp. MMS18-M83]WAH95243.1 hypothetical protein OW521_12280 [Arthrobacter sp. MMS18-M83]
MARTDINPDGIDRDLRKLVSSFLAASCGELTPDEKIWGLGAEAREALDAVVERLVVDARFEHIGRKELERSFFEYAVNFRNNARVSTPALQEAAIDILGSMARKPLTRTVYLGIEHIGLAHGTVAGPATFLRLSEDKELKDAFERLGSSCPELVCAVEVTAGTDELMLERARERVAIALALVRQRYLFGFAAKIYPDQVLFGLNGSHVQRCGGAITLRGRWRKPAPIPEDLSGLEEWNTSLRGLSDLYLRLGPNVRSRADVCISWLDVAALTENWRIIIPTVFSAVESLLIPDDFQSKGAAIAVRSIAVKIATKHHVEFLHVADAYRLRNDLVHGNTTEKMITAETLPRADSLRRWAFGVFADYVELAASRSPASAKILIRDLSAECDQACDLLRKRGHREVADQYAGKN